MSMGMEVTLADEAEVLAVAGSGDDELIDWLRFTGDGTDSLAGLDDAAADLIEDECPGFTHADALADVVAGRVTRPDAGFVYANVLEHVFGAFGRWVHARTDRLSFETIAGMDRLFAAHGVGLRFRGGLVGRPPRNRSRG